MVLALGGAGACGPSPHAHADFVVEWNGETASFVADRNAFVDCLTPSSAELEFTAEDAPEHLDAFVTRDSVNVSTGGDFLFLRGGWSWWPVDAQSPGNLLARDCQVEEGDRTGEQRCDVDFEMYTDFDVGVEPDPEADYTVVEGRLTGTFSWVCEENQTSRGCAMLGSCG